MYGKIVTRSFIISQARLLRSTGRKIVFTNGCFDILHFGHINYLVSAKSLGDILIVGLNSDSSVRDLKGAGRPINDETARAEVLSALQCVDYVVNFNEPTPAELISEIKPEVLVKGGDYKTEDIAGADFVRSTGGEVLLLPFEKGYSTSEIIGKIKGD